jgi:hypothetical protein
MANGWAKDQEYRTNDYIYASDINKMISLFNSFIVFENNEFKGIKIPKTGLTLYGYSTNSKGEQIETPYLLTVDENGILQTEKL